PGLRAPACDCRMSGFACLARGRVCCEPSGATRCRRDRLPSTRTLKRSQTETSGPLTEECSAGFDSIRIACAHAGLENPASRTMVSRIEIEGPSSAPRKCFPSQSGISRCCSELSAIVEEYYVAIVCSRRGVTPADVQPDQAADQYCLIHDSGDCLQDDERPGVTAPGNDVAVADCGKGHKAEEDELGWMQHSPWLDGVAE